MTAEEKALLDQCASILLNRPSHDDLSTVGGTLRLLANGYSAGYSNLGVTGMNKKGSINIEAIEAEYNSLVEDHRRKGTLQAINGHDPKAVPLPYAKVLEAPQQ